MVGVKLFHSAMNSHRANELIYEAQKRATTVAMQITAGNENLSVAEFSNPEGYTFGVEKNPANENQFNITLTGVNTDVCQKMKNAVGEGTSVRVISEFCDKLTYNNDLSTTGYTTDYNTNESGCQNAGYTWCAKGEGGVASKCLESSVTDCCANTTYDEQCQTCDSATGTVTDKANNTACYFGANSTLSKCNAGVCLDPGVTTTKKCLTNDDCGGPGSGYYCKYTTSNSSTYCTKDAPTAMGCAGITNPTECAKAGTCTLVGNITKFNLTDMGPVVLCPSMNWWSADNWCKAIGKSLIDVEKLQVYKNGQTLVTEGSSGDTAACAKGKACTSWGEGVAANAVWKGNSGADARTLTDARDANGELYRTKYSPALLDLAQKYRGSIHWFWTASNLGDSGCYTWAVRLFYGTMYNRVKTDNYNGLCQ